MNGSKDIASRYRGKHPIRALSFDGNGTIFIPSMGRNLATLTLMIAERVLGRKVNIDGGEFEEYLNRLRIDLALSGRMSHRQGTVDYWGDINAAALNHFGCACGMDQGRKISLKLRGDAVFYTIPGYRKRLIQKVIRKGFGGDGQVRVGRAFITSSSDRRMLKRILRRYGMANLFHDIVTPDELGGTEKAGSVFFRKMLDYTGVDPETTAHIGNSVFKDAAAARLGIWTILLEGPNSSISCEEVEKLHGADSLARIFPARNMADVENILENRFISVG
jgi:Predicted hydrolase (HAD superfamily)